MSGHAAALHCRSCAFSASRSSRQPMTTMRLQGSPPWEGQGLPSVTSYTSCTACISERPHD